MSGLERALQIQGNIGRKLLRLDRRRRGVGVKKLGSLQCGLQRSYLYLQAQIAAVVMCHVRVELVA